jgi:TIR domain
MSTVFISYCTGDHFFAELARLKLESADIPVWVDKANLRAGDDWRQEIDRGISDSFAIVVALSAESVQSPYVTYEWASAIGKNKPVVPVLLDSCERHPRLEPIQYIDFSNTSHQPWQELIDRIRDIRENAELPASDEEAAPVESDAEAVAPLPRSEEERAADQILAYLNRHGFQMVSFERIRQTIDSGYDDRFLAGVIAAHRTIFRRAKLRGNMPGIARL